MAARGRPTATRTTKKASEPRAPRTFHEETTQKRLVRVEKTPVPGTVVFRALALDRSELVVQAVDPSTTHNVPAVHFSLWRPASANTLATLAPALDPTFDRLTSRIEPLATLLAVQARGGRYRRARRYGQELRAASEVIGSLDPEQRAAACACKTSRELIAALPKRLFRADLAEGLVHLYALFALRFDVDVAAVAPSDSPPPNVAWSKAPRLSEVASHFPSFARDPTLDALVTRPTRETLVAVARREDRYVVLAHRYAPPIGGVSTGSLVADPLRLPGEPIEDSIARAAAAVPILADVVGELPIAPCGATVAERWDRVFASARAGHAPYCTDVCMVPLPSARRRTWRWLIRRDSGLAVATFDADAFALVEVEDLAVTAPDAGGGLAFAATQLDRVLGGLDLLAARFWDGAPPPRDASAWKRALRALVEPPWRPLLHRVAPEVLAWVGFG